MLGLTGIYVPLFIQIFSLVHMHQRIVFEDVVVNAVRLRLQQQFVQIVLRFYHEIVAGRRQVSFAVVCAASSNYLTISGHNIKFVFLVESIAKVEVLVIQHHGGVQFLALGAQVSPVRTKRRQFVSSKLESTHKHTLFLNLHRIVGFVVRQHVLFHVGMLGVAFAADRTHERPLAGVDALVLL